MKKLFTIISLFVSISVSAQTRVKVDANGNYVAVKRADTAANKATGKTITTSDGKEYPVMISANGKLYYMRTSKAGNVYKCYIKTV